MPSRKELADAIRFLSLDAIQRAKSGHPGAPMGMADMAEVLWNDFMKHNPADPRWPDRDRFVLSNGHASMLLYAVLHLTGYNISIEEIKNFRCLHSKTPGHPECNLDIGIETTTGPLGQGLANAVGMAIAEKILAAQFNREGHTIVDHYTYVFLGDGCLMEGISHEACSLAGTLGLGKLIALYDDNGISIDGPVQGWFTDDTPKRFEAYDWHVVKDVDGHHPQKIYEAIQEARAVKDRPSLICCKTQIAFGAPSMAGSHKSHGAPLGEDEVQATREKLKWQKESFRVPEEAYQAWDARVRGAKWQLDWEKRFEAYEHAYPELAREFKRRINGILPDNFSQQAWSAIKNMADRELDLATRKGTKEALNQFGPLLPELLGGSADLSGSTNTFWSDSRVIQRNFWDANFIHYGVREFSMAAIMNGITLHGGFIPYAGTFLIFSDYAKNAMRMSALMAVRTIYVLTHDSIGVGEDGPTHQPVEQLASLRVIPNMVVWRPCDAVESLVAWKCALENDLGPSALVLSRQALKHQVRDEQALTNISRGAYILMEATEPLEAIIIATGSEVEPSVQAARILQQKGKGVRVVSMPCVERFEVQDRSYQDLVLPPEITCRLVVEAGVTSIWHKYAGHKGRIIGLDQFGRSAPANHLFQYFGFTAENIENELLDMLEIS